MSGDDDEDLREFVATHLPHLRRTAFLMSGDWELAIDLAWSSLARLVADARRGVVADPVIYAYAELIHACRRRHRRREHVFVATAGAEGIAAESILVLDALHKLAPRCRAVLVLRHWGGFELDTIAAILELDSERVQAYERAGLAALDQLLPGPEMAVTSG